MNIADAIDIMESVAGVTDESTPVGEAWALIMSCIHHHPQPIPVSERLPGPGDCLDEGWAWFFNPRTGWRQASQPVHYTYTHWLPAHDLPLPTTPNPQP